MACDIAPVPRSRKEKRGLSRALVIPQPIGGLRGFGGGREDGFLVVLQNTEPVLDVAGMICAWLGCETKITAKESSSKLGDIS